jgi:tRNA G18 (ribose-2'-O)-methylase SpoU
MRGYFGVGAEGLSKPLNLGNLFRSAHAFGASFLFTIGGRYTAQTALADTSHAPGHIPFYHYDSAADLRLPAHCRLVGVELVDDAIDLPSFRHPHAAAYVFGRERASLSPALIERCDFVVRIPTRFSINVATAGAVVMYDRIISHGRFPRRPVRAGGPVEPLPGHVFGAPIMRRPPEDG